MIPPTPRRLRFLRAAAWSCICLGSFVSAEDRVSPPIRDLRVVSRHVWAVGDGGVVLQSRDGGITFSPKEGLVDSGFHIQALRLDGPSVCLLGGRAVEGFPGRGARGVLHRSDDGGETFESMAVDALGWLYDGIVISDSALLLGEAIPTGPGGVFHSVDGGAHWNSLTVRGRGYLRSAVFDGFRFGYLVGANRRIVSLRDFGEPESHAAPIASTAELTAVAMTAKSTGWCVGQDGSVLTSQPNTPDWRQALLPIPAGTRRLSDFECLDVRENRICIAGGLTRRIYVSDDAGNSFKAVEAPGPGPVHTVGYVPGSNGKPRLLAGGDAGCIWYSDDEGLSWRQAHGPDTTDVLFIVAAGDTSIYPAVVAHAAAGLNVAVLYATVPNPRTSYPAAPPDQWLRAAAVRCGAGGVTALHDFPSVANAADGSIQSPEDISAAWSKALDAPAEPILLEQLTAAIRLYRPTILVVGSEDADGNQNVAEMENRLIARLAQRAAAEAANADASAALTKAGLSPHSVKRIYVGQSGNDRYTPPWELPPPIPRGRGMVRVDGTAFPRGKPTCVSLLAQEAIWLLGDPSLLHRPAEITAYHCRTASEGGELFTRGLGKNYFPRIHADSSLRRIAANANLRMADVGDRIMTALPELLRVAEEKAAQGLDPSLPAADRILLAWRRLCEQGRLVHAQQFRDAFLRVGTSHPLYRMMNVRTLATTCSMEYTAQRKRVSPDVSPIDAVIKRGVKKFASWHPWADDGAGRLLLARTLLATAPPEETPQARIRAMKILGAAAREAYPDVWKRLADFELNCLIGRPRRPAGRTVLPAPLVTQPGKIDGRLNEDVWKTLPAKILLPPGGKPNRSRAVGQVQAFRTVGAIVLGLRLAEGVGRVWRVTLAIDSDRDAWTQLQIEFDTTGKKSSHLACRLGPRTKLPYVVGDKRNADHRLYLLQAPRETGDEGQHTFELALPIQQVGVDSAAAGLWNLQIRAAAEDPDGVEHFYLQPQSDPELLPERFGLLEYPRAM
ncbi:MAG: hypothetical protein JXA11_07185 [Phycisphaerae bacterium]|nr:hypothetical protein [Phycisphaerae bacterium]